MNYQIDLKHIKFLTPMIKAYFLVIILFISIVITSIIHNAATDTFLTILNLFIVIQLIFNLYRKILKSVFEICNP